MNAFLSATVCTSVKIQTVDIDVAVMISSKWTLQIPKIVFVSDFEIALRALGVKLLHGVGSL